MESDDDGGADPAETADGEFDLGSPAKKPRAVDGASLEARLEHVNQVRFKGWCPPRPGEGGERAGDALATMGGVHDWAADVQEVQARIDDGFQQWCTRLAAGDLAFQSVCLTCSTVETPKVVVVDDKLPQGKRGNPFRNLIRHFKAGDSEKKTQHEKAAAALSHEASGGGVSMQFIIDERYRQLTGLEKSGVFGSPFDDCGGGNASSSSSATAAAAAALSPAGMERLTVRGILPQVANVALPMLSPAEELLQEFPGVFQVDEARGSYACNVCPFQSNLNVRNLVTVAGQHVAGNNHKQRAVQMVGQRRLTDMTVVADPSIPAAATAMMKRPPPEFFCHGFWLPEVTYKEGGCGVACNARRLLVQTPHLPGKTWRSDPFKPIHISGGAPIVGSTLLYKDHKYRVIETLPFTGQLKVQSLTFEGLKRTVPAGACEDIESNYEGTYFSTDPPCSGWCGGVTNHPRPNLMCPACEKIPDAQDFRERTLKQREISLAGGFSIFTENKYLSRPALEAKQRMTKESYDQERMASFGLLSHLTRARGSRDSAKERLQKHYDCGNLTALAQDLAHCAEHGSFDDHAASLNFISDLVKSMRKMNADGSSSHGNRWHESTNRIFALTAKFGGPRTHFLFQKNIGGPHLDTSRRLWRKAREDMAPGLTDAAFASVGRILAPYVAKLGLPAGERLPIQIAIDETGIKAGGVYREATDELIGYCGKRTDGEAHKCAPIAVLLGDDGGTERRIKEWAEHGKYAPYVSLILLNPLSHKLPSLGIALLPTCNTFTKDDVHDQNVKIESLFQEHIATSLPLDLVGFASDGDSRRSYQQKERMAGSIAEEDALRIDHPSCRLHGKYTGGVVSGVDAQDPKHVLKCFLGALAGKRDLFAGRYLSTYNHVAMAFDEFGAGETAMTKAARDRNDRQDVLSPVMASGLQVSKKLKGMQVSYGS